MRIILSGGGTGGHIYPAIAIANALRQDNPNNEILFVGAQGKMEMQQVPAAGYQIIGLPIRGIQRKILWKNISLPPKLIVSWWKARGIIKRFKPDVVIGTGGYASAPLLYAATQKRIPTLIQEQNAYAGLTNRLLAKWVDRVCVAYEGMHRYFPAHKILVTGNPVRQDIVDLATKRQIAYDYFGLAVGKKCLLILGGSQGAKMLNEIILQTLPQFLADDIQVIWSVGHGYFEYIKKQLPQYYSGLKILPFIEKIDLAYVVADGVVARAGALAITELCMVQKPTIFIPSPNVAANHQVKNVTPLVAKGAAILLEEGEAKNKLGLVLLPLLHNEAQRQRLIQNMKFWAKPQATSDIVKLIYKLAYGH